MNRVRLTYLAATILSLGILAIGYVLGISPLLTSAGSAALERVSIETTNESLSQRLIELEQAQRDIGTHTTTLGALREKVPASGEYDAYIDQLSALAAATGVTLQKITFGDAVPFGAATAPVAPAPSEGEATPATPVPTDPAATPAPTEPIAPAGAAAGQLLSLPVQVGVVGLGESVRAFTDALQQGGRYTLVTKVSLTSDEGAGDVLAAESTAVIDGFIWALPE